ncbi:MAG TPA: outer membrane beta-barrel protein [Prosthecobacter sp.]|nr:outer membrane beta-barrel protein [Prosthecobacter sp.]
MNKKLTLLASLGAVILTGGSVLAGTPTYDKAPQMTQPLPECGPWFSGISGGAWWVQDYDVSIPLVFAGDVELQFETGFGINITPIGYRLSDTFSLSLETGYYEAETDGATIGGVGFPLTDGQLRIAPAVLNANFNFPVSDTISLYLTAGGGVAYRDLDFQSGFVFPGATFHDSGWNAIAQAKAGVSFEVAPCHFLAVGYRYQHIFSSPDDIQGHSAEVSYTFHW